MSLTLLMMAAVISVFATVSQSVANRRSGIVMSGRLRDARAVLQADLANHTSPLLASIRPEDNLGYVEIIEGPQCDFDPSMWLRDENNDGVPDAIGPSSSQLQLDLASSQLPSSNLYLLPGSFRDSDSNNNGRDDNDVRDTVGGVTDGLGLGDWDDVLMLTVRNENEPFIGRVPDSASLDGTSFNLWGFRKIESQLAEVIWFAVENPVEDTKSYYFGEPGMRTVYRRAFLIAPWLDYGFVVEGVKTGPGVLRVLPDSVDDDEADQAAAALIAFQEQYDLSVRLEWNPLLGSDGRWVVKANTLADLTKRENRMEHSHLTLTATDGLKRKFPYRCVSSGAGVGNGVSLNVRTDPERRVSVSTDNAVISPVVARGDSSATGSDRGDVVLYSVDDSGAAYGNRPSVQVPLSVTISERAQGDHAPTVRAIVNEDGQVAMFTNGLVPLSGDRRGEDVMLSNMLAFDLKVYDPEAPLLGTIWDTNDEFYPGDAVDPGSPSWGVIANNLFSNANSDPRYVIGRGAYVDLGYFHLHSYFSYRNSGLPSWSATNLGGARTLLGDSVFARGMNGDSKLGGAPVFFPHSTNGPNSFQPYRTYETWSTSYENNGLNDDEDFDANGVALVDEGTNGFDDDGVLGVDDPGERETAPPYDTPLRGLQVTLRAYELDSRQIREVNVKQTFVPR